MHTTHRARSARTCTQPRRPRSSHRAMIRSPHPARRCSDRPRARVLFFVLIALALTACATSRPAPPPPPAPARPLPRPAPRGVAHASWTFQQQPDECRATARAGHFNLSVVARATDPILLILSPVRRLRHGRLELQFTGPAGKWALSAAETRYHAAIASFGSGDTGLSRLLLMLSGGTVTAGPAASGVPLLKLPPSGADGGRWFGCVRGIRG